MEALQALSTSFYKECQNSTANMGVYVPYAVVSSTLLPLYVSVLYVGVAERRRRRAASHSDVLTFHMVAVEALGVLGSLLYMLSVVTGSDALLLAGVLCYSVMLPGQALFHTLACAERYVAAVHAVAYMRLGRGGVRVRNGGVACVWLACVLWVVATERYFPAFPTAPFLVVGGASTLVTCFCCLAVLRVLIGPGPAGAGPAGAGPRVSPAKRRALRLVGGITALLALRFLGMLACFGLLPLLALSVERRCMLMDAGLWLTLPSSLLLPLLHLHRAGKLPRCRRDHQGPARTTRD